MNPLRALFSVKGTSPPVKKSGGGGGLLQPPVEPKVKPKQSSFPGYMTTTVASTAARPKNDLNLANVDITSTYRFGASTSDVLRNLRHGNADLGGAVSAHLRMGIPEKYMVFAYNPDGSFNVDAVRFCLEFLGRLETMPGYETGFTTVSSIQSTSEALGLEVLMEGALACELVLNKARQPWYFAPVAVKQIKFYDDFGGGTKTLKPVQVVGGEEIDLDIPNFFMVWLDQSVLEPYPQSPMQSAIQPVLAGTTFLNDLRRLCERHVYPRYNLTLNQELLAKHMTEEELIEPEKKKAFLNAAYAQVADVVNNLGVEEAIVHFDFLSVEYVGGQDGDVPNTFETVKSIYDNKIATGAKSNGSILGHGTGTQNIASTETMLAMVTSNGLIRVKLNEVYSKMFTMAARLMGLDVTVSFEYDEIELRPKSELEAFYAQRQSRLLEQLSYGFITDEEFCMRMTHRLPPAGFTPLSGTQFLAPVPADTSGNNYSGTGVGGGGSGGSAANQARAPQTPASKRGKA